MGDRFHFIGIGGAGMSAIATVLLERGAAVSGSDMKESRYTRQLAKAGARIFIGHRAENISDATVVVVSTAIPKTNPELAAALAEGKKILRRAEMLAELAVGKKCVAVGGTHGKTTTSSMISLVLSECGADPTFVIGGELNDIGTNAKAGSGELVVAEADESDASILALQPHVGVVTNCEADHLDFYNSIDEIKEVFSSFLHKIPTDGLALICGDDRNLKELSADLHCRVTTYGYEPGNTWRADNVELTPFGSSFTVIHSDEVIGEASLRVPGRHNILNALAAVALASWAGIDSGSIIRALSGFSGVKRRFQIIGEAKGFTIVDDYAHHPTEIKATLAAAKSGDWRRVIGLFQPHRYSRTLHLATDFGESFGDADYVVLTDVYAAGETPIPGVTGKLLVNAVLAAYPGKKVAYFPRREQLTDFLASELTGGDVLLTMGAGDIWSIGEEILGKSAGRSYA